jgi:hypothetical protein
MRNAHIGGIQRGNTGWEGEGRLLKRANACVYRDECVSFIALQEAIMYNVQIKY